MKMFTAIVILIAMVAFIIVGIYALIGSTFDHEHWLLHKNLNCESFGLGGYSEKYDCCLCKEGQMSNATNGICCGRV